VVTDVLAAVRAVMHDGRRAALATQVDGPTPGVTGLVDESGRAIAGKPLPAPVVARVAEVLSTAAPVVVTGDAQTWFLEPVLPRPRLIVFGAIAAADALVPMAAAAGYSVTVVDEREWLARSERYPAAERVVCGRAAQVLESLAVDASTCAVSFLHEARLEDELLVALLTGPARYVGSMGSRRSTAAKRLRLATAGVGSEALDRLYAPIGLDIGSRTPQEIAVAILAEIVASGRGGR
jgi:xanthine dehydrogenase accessory factor